MSNEFTLPTNEPGLSAYGVLKNSVGKYWNGTAFETYATANFANYVRTVAEAGASGIYESSMPSTITDKGRYELFFYDKGEGAAAGEGDRFLGSCAISWTGSIVESEDVELENSIITLQEAKNYLKITSAAEDEILTNLLNEISAWVQRFTGRNLIRTTHTEYYSGDGSDELILRNSPIVSLTSLHVDSEREFGSTTEIDADNLILKKQKGIIKAFNLFGQFPCGDSNIKVVYVAGYTTDYVGGTMPFDIRLAVKRILDKQYRLGYTHRKLDNQSESIEGMNITFREDAIPNDAVSILESHRQWVPAEQFSYAD